MLGLKPLNVELNNFLNFCQIFFMLLPFEITKTTLLEKFAL